jgi:hypothetical protein
LVRRSLQEHLSSARVGLTDFPQTNATKRVFMSRQTLTPDTCSAAGDHSVPVDAPIDSSAHVPAELDAVELNLHAASYPLVYVHADDQEALDALILTGLIHPHRAKVTGPKPRLRS